MRRAAMRRDAGVSRVARGIFGLLNPIPFGCFVAALIFDIIYQETAEILWDKAAAWLILFGLFFAVIPRLINLTQVWITARQSATRIDKLDFWLNLCAIVAAIVNEFVHSRDAYAVVPTGAWLSAVTVLLIAVGLVLEAVDGGALGTYAHE
jgi:uncharacterized membrane protein